MEIAFGADTAFACVPDESAGLADELDDDDEQPLEDDFELCQSCATRAAA